MDSLSSAKYQTEAHSKIPDAIVSGLSRRSQLSWARCNADSNGSSTFYSATRSATARHVTRLGQAEPGQHHKEFFPAPSNHQIRSTDAFGQRFGQRRDLLARATLVGAVPRALLYAGVTAPPLSPRCRRRSRRGINPSSAIKAFVAL